MPRVLSNSRLVVLCAVLVIPMPLALVLLLVGLSTSSLWLVNASMGVGVLGVIGLVIGLWLNVSTYLQLRRAGR